MRKNETSTCPNGLMVKRFPCKKKSMSSILIWGFTLFLLTAITFLNNKKQKKIALITKQNKNYKK